MLHEKATSADTPIIRINDGATRFIFRTIGALYRFEGVYATYIYDIRGGISAYQWGMVSMATRLALRNGIDAYLLSKGFHPGKSSATMPTQVLRLRLLAIAVGDVHELYREARELEFSNPSTPKEIEDYAYRCFSYVEERLGMKWFRPQHYRNYSDEHLRRISKYYGMIEFLEQHEVPLLRSTLTQEEIRWDIRRRLAPQYYEDVSGSAWAWLPDREQTNSP